MGKQGKIDSFFSKKITIQLDVDIPTEPSNLATEPSLASDSGNTSSESLLKKQKPVEYEVIDLNSLELDPGLRRQIWEYPLNQQDDIRRAYLSIKPYQPDVAEYPLSKRYKDPRRFQRSWHEIFKWLEYSPTKDKAYCKPCFIFNKPSGSLKHTTFTVGGFDSWKKVRSGKECPLLRHVGGLGSSHHAMEKACSDLMNQKQHITRLIDTFTTEQIASNRVRLIASINLVRLFDLPGVPFRGHDESIESTNRGNFLEFLKILAIYNKELSNARAKAPKNAKYTSPLIQKEILNVFSVRVKNAIRVEIGDAKYCVLVDEARDESKREQMSIVLRFVDKSGFIQERFFGLVHVSDTSALTLKNALYSVLAHYNLDVQNIRGQGYDGASNMRGEFNGLQALVLKDCKSAYYVHCFAHRLQLALVAAAKDVTSIHQFFDKLTFIVNIVVASCKRSDELKKAHADDIAHLIAINELETGRGMNQVTTLQRHVDTRWSSHLRSLNSLLNMFSAACSVLLNIMDDGLPAQRASATSTYDEMVSFEFVFILHLMKELLEITDMLCQALQCKSQDIVNAMELVSSTTKCLQRLRDDKWDTLITKVKSFCEGRNIEVSDLSAQHKMRHKMRRGQTHHLLSNFTVEDHYRVDFFYAAIDAQLQELNVRFSEDAVELLVLSTALNPQDISEAFRVMDMCNLVEKFYPDDFTQYERDELRRQLEHYECNVVKGSNYKTLSTVSELCRWLVKTNKSVRYYLIFRVIVLVLTLPVSTVTSERSFSAMKIVKTSLRNKMEDGYLSDALMLFIEKKIAKSISIEVIIDDFQKRKKRRVLFS